MSPITTIPNPRAHKNVAVIIENSPYYSGGRYYGFMFTVALQELADRYGWNVSYYSQIHPPFEEDFASYRPVNFKKVKNYQAFKDEDVQADLYIGFPTYGTQAAVYYGEKYRKPVIGVVFDAVPIIKERRPEDYPVESVYFQAMDNAIRSMRGIKLIAISEETRDGSLEHLGKKPRDFSIVYPCVNTRVLDLVPNQKRKDQVVYCGRVVSRKNFIETAQAFATLPDEWRLQIITSRCDLGPTKRMLRDLGIEQRVDFHLGVGDAEKFRVMKESKIMLNASHFEGYGMWVIEGAACGLPVVYYDYPIPAEMVRVAPALEKYLHPAKYKNVDSLCKTLQETAAGLKDWKYEQEITHSFGFMVDQLDKALRGVAV